MMSRFLFIPSIQSGDWPTLYLKCTVILIVWTLMIVAVLLDLWSGVECARSTGEKPRSDKFRRTITKIGDYWRVLAFGLIIDIIASILPFYTLPYSSILVSVACILIELKSVIENSKIKKSAAARIPEIMTELLACTDKEKMLELLLKWQQLNDKYKKNNTD
jgi:hypothetical protein